MTRTHRLLRAAVMTALAATFLLSAPGPIHGSSHNVPGKPTISESELLYRGFRIHWDAPGSDGGSPIVRYEVEHKFADDNVWRDGRQVGRGRKATIIELPAGYEYKVRVRAVNANGPGPWSDDLPSNLVPRGVNPQADPPDVTIVPRNTSLTVSWDTPAYKGGASGGITHYNVQYARKVGSTYTYKDWTVNGSARITGNSVTLTDLENGQDYMVRVRAHNGSADGHWSAGHPGAPAPGTPFLKVEELVTGLLRPWDLGFTPDGTMLFTERAGSLSARLADGTVRTLAQVRDTPPSAEGGLMSILVDPRFSVNRRIYTCQTNNNGSPPNYEPSFPFTVEVIAWTVNAGYTTATRAATPLVRGIPGGVGRHNGCRLRFGPSGYLWIATGDGLGATNPQSLSSLGGKVLRVNASTGAGAPGNPFRSHPRVYTYGHRNIQGLALRPGTREMWAVEHGSYQDDEINLLVAGKNYGWDPVDRDEEGVVTYTEIGVPMTDLTKFPSAVEAKWSSGEPTLAVSGGIFLEGDRWGAWEGQLAAAALKDKQLYLFAFNADGEFQDRISVPELNRTQGRLRSPVMGPDGALYITTSNGRDHNTGRNLDKILKVTPVYHPGQPGGPTVVPGDAGELDVSWTAPTDDGGDPVTGYRLRYSTDGTSWTEAPGTATGLTRTITGLDGDGYQVQVRAVNGAGGGAWSQSGTAEVEGGKPYAALIAKMYEWRNDPQWRDHKSHTDRWDRALKAFGETVEDQTLTKMTAAEAQEFADTDWGERWVPVAAALWEIESGEQANRAPTVAAAIADVTDLEAGATRDVSLAEVFNDPDGDALTVTAISDDEAVATVSVASDGSSLTASGVSEGTATVTVTAQDADGEGVSDAFEVEVVKKYAALIAQMYQWRNDPDWKDYKSHTDRWDRALLAFDEEVADKTLTKMTAAEAQEFADTDWGERWVPVAKALWEIEGGVQPTPSPTPSPTPTPTPPTPNRAPTVSSAIADVTDLEAQATRDVSLSGVFDDPDGDALTITAASSDEAVVTVSVAADGSKLTLAGVAEGTATITVTAEDADGEGVSDDFEVSVEPEEEQTQPNRAPTVSSAIANATIVNETGTERVSLSSVFHDADGDALTIRAASYDEAIARVSLASDGSSLTLNARARGYATIAVTADDGNGGTVSDTFTVTVKASPVVTSAISDLIGLEAGAKQQVSLSGVFYDADGDPLTVTVASSDETRATATVASDGSSLTLAGVAEGTATITVTAQDSDGNRVSDAFEVAVEPEEEEQPTPEGTPTVVSPLPDVSMRVLKYRAISLSDVFDDPDGDDLTISAVASDYSVVAAWMNGSSLLVVARSEGTATITVTAEDPDGNTVSDAFEVTVRPAS